MRLREPTFSGRHQPLCAICSRQLSILRRARCFAADDKRQLELVPAPLLQSAPGGTEITKVPSVQGLCWHCTKYLQVKTVSLNVVCEL